MEALHLELLGAPRISRNGAPVTGFVSSKVQALLYYLALTARPHTRASLAGLLWGELPEPQARMNLRHALANLRQLVGDHLQITRETVAFDHTAPYWLDVEAVQGQFGASAATAPTPDLRRLREALALYRGDLLEGFYVRDARSFEDWLLTQRERLRQLTLHMLHGLTAELLERGEYVAALDYTTRLIALDPLREEAHRQLMTILARSGRREAALEQYKHCVRLLADEIGVEPALETTALFEQIRTGALGLDTAQVRLAASQPATGRRTLTLLACQLVGLSALADRLEPDQFAEVLRAYRALCGDVAGRFGGQLGEHRSDEVLVAFGHPHTSQDDALAAVQAGVALGEALRAFQPLAALPGPLSFRIGIHSGLVLVGSHGSAPGSPLNIVGLALHTVHRLQTLAEPGAILISAATERLVREQVDSRYYGAFQVDGQEQPLAVFQVPQRRQAEDSAAPEQAGADPALSLIALAAQTLGLGADEQQVGPGKRLDHATTLQRVHGLAFVASLPGVRRSAR